MHIHIVIYIYIYMYVSGCCPKFLVPEMANFTRKKILSRNFRGTIAVHDSDNMLI